jgi:tetratricopeptide (TPR) repeat protein
MTLPQELRTAAWFFGQNTGNPKAVARFQQELEAHSSPAVLVELADQFAALPEVSIAALQRLVAIAPAHVGYRVQLGRACFMAGEDDEAARQLEEARRLVPEDLEVLNLAAMLAQTDEQKREVYARILELYPDNRAAFEYLVALREPDHDHAAHDEHGHNHHPHH